MASPTASMPQQEEAAASPKRSGGGSRWRRALFNVIKYPLIIIVVNILLLGYIKRSLGDAELEFSLRPAVPPFH